MSMDLLGHRDKGKCQFCLIRLFYDRLCLIFVSVCHSNTDSFHLAEYKLMHIMIIQPDSRSFCTE